MDWIESAKDHRLLDILSCVEYQDVLSSRKGLLEEIIQYRISISQKDGFDTDFCGRSSLYLALRFNPSPHSIKILYEANKSALETHDFFGVAPVSLLYHDAYPIDLLSTFLELCPAKFIIPKYNLQDNMLERLNFLWTKRLQNEGLDVCDLKQDPALLLQWKKLICTILKVQPLLEVKKLVSLSHDGLMEFFEHDQIFTNEAVAAIELCRSQKLSTDLLLLILKVCHRRDFRESHCLVNILSNHDRRKQLYEEHDNSLEAIILYRLWVSPTEAFQSDSCGRTPLYHLLRLRPTPNSIQILYEANRHALTTPDFCGVSPTALAFLRDYPIQILKTLLKLRPEAFILGLQHPQFTGRSFLNTLIATWDRLSSSKAVTVKSLKTDLHLREEWEKFMATLCVASDFFNDNLTNTGSSLEVHAALQLRGRVPIPASLISFIMHMYPSQLSSNLVLKNRSMLPLHYLIEEFSPTDANEDNRKGADFIHILRMMIHVSPKVTKIPHPESKNSFPLLMALKRNLKYDDGVSDLANKFPEALYAIEEKSGLAPFMLAAEGNCYDLDTIFYVLRQAPSTCPKI